MINLFLLSIYTHTAQVYCTLTEQGGTQRCGVCDTQDPDKAHPPR